MNYKHSWVNDWARYFAIDINGTGYEYLNKPAYKHKFGLPARWENGGKMGSISVYFNDATPSDSLQQRYTDQQMELEAKGWTLWNAGDGKPDLNEEVVLDIFINNSITEANCVDDISWLDHGIKLAWRLSNANGYKDGVKVDCDCGKYMASTGGNHLPKCGLSKESYIDPDKPEWKDGELPPFGTKCEAIWSELPDGGNPEWLPVTFKGGFDSKLWFSNWDGEIVIPAHEVKFRPIQTKKERVINEVMLVVEILENNTGDEVLSIMRELYDAGMLSMPDNGEE